MTSRTAARERIEEQKLWAREAAEDTLKKQCSRCREPHGWPQWFVRVGAVTLLLLVIKMAFVRQTTNHIIMDWVVAAGLIAYFGYTVIWKARAAHLSRHTEILGFAEKDPQAAIKYLAKYSRFRFARYCLAKEEMDIERVLGQVIGFQEPEDYPEGHPYRTQKALAMAALASMLKDMLHSVQEADTHLADEADQKLLNLIHEYLRRVAITRTWIEELALPVLHATDKTDVRLCLDNIRRHAPHVAVPVLRLDPPDQPQPAMGDSPPGE